MDRVKKDMISELKIEWEKYKYVIYFDGACSFNRK